VGFPCLVCSLPVYVCDWVYHWLCGSGLGPDVSPYIVFSLVRLVHNEHLTPHTIYHQHKQGKESEGLGKTHLQWVASKKKKPEAILIKTVSSYALPVVTHYPTHYTSSVPRLFSNLPTTNGKPNPDREGRTQCDNRAKVPTTSKDAKRAPK